MKPLTKNERAFVAKKIERNPGMFLTRREALEASKNSQHRNFPHDIVKSSYYDLDLERDVPVYVLVLRTCKSRG